MIYQIIYLFINRFLGSKPPAIRIEGEIKNSKIEDNVSIGRPVLKIDKNVIGSSIKRNISYLPEPKNLHWFWKILLDVSVFLFGSFLIYKLGWK